MTPFIILGTLALMGSASCMTEKVEKMYLSRTMGSDLTPSATGYIFRSDGHGLGNLVHLGAPVVHHHLNTFPGNSQTFAGYNQAPSVKPLQAPTRPTYYSAPYSGYVPAAHLAANVAPLRNQGYNANPKPTVSFVSHSQSEESSDESSDENDYDDGSYYPGKYADSESYHDDGSYHLDHSNEYVAPNYAADFDHFVGHYGDHDSDSHDHGHDHGHSFSHGGGSKHGSDHHSSHGEKGDKGYKNHHSFDKGGHGSHHKDGHKGHYDDISGHKSGHSDSGHHYSQHHSGDKAHKGGKFKEAKGHKKGEKTSGFHKKFHKDEYKKDHKFYDDAHKYGHFNKHGGVHANHHSKKGGHKKGDHHSSAYHHDDHGKTGHSAKDHVYGHDLGHSSKDGDESFHNHHSDFGKKGSESHGSENGFSGHH